MWNRKKKQTKKNDGNILPNEKLNLSKRRQNRKSNDTLCGQSIRNLTEYYYTHITIMHIFHENSSLAPSEIVNFHYAPSKTVNCHRVAHAAYAMALGVPNMHKKINGDV